MTFSVFRNRGFVLKPFLAMVHGTNERFLDVSRYILVVLVDVIRQGLFGGEDFNAHFALEQKTGLGVLYSDVRLKSWLAQERFGARATVEKFVAVHIKHMLRGFDPNVKIQVTGLAT